jgi:hypothetical protein
VWQSFVAVQTNCFSHSPVRMTKKTWTGIFNLAPTWRHDIQ